MSAMDAFTSMSGSRYVPALTTTVSPRCAADTALAMERYGPLGATSSTRCAGACGATAVASTTKAARRTLTLMRPARGGGGRPRAAGLGERAPRYREERPRQG